jgi:hypothetical protein
MKEVVPKQRGKYHSGLDYGIFSFQIFCLYFFFDKLYFVSIYNAHLSC